MAAISGSLEVFNLQEVLGLMVHKPGQWLVRIDGDMRGYVGMRDGRLVCASEAEDRADLTRLLSLENVGAATDDLVRRHLVNALASLSVQPRGTFAVEPSTELPDDLGFAFTLQEVGRGVGELLSAWNTRGLAAATSAPVIADPGPVPEDLRGLRSVMDQPASIHDLVMTSGRGLVGTVVGVAQLIDAGCAHLGDAVTGGDAGSGDTMNSLAQNPAVTLQHSGADGDVGEVSDDDLLAILLRGVRGV